MEDAHCLLKWEDSRQSFKIVTRPTRTTRPTRSVRPTWALRPTRWSHGIILKHPKPGTTWHYLAPPGTCYTSSSPGVYFQAGGASRSWEERSNCGFSVVFMKICFCFKTWWYGWTSRIYWFFVIFIVVFLVVMKMMMSWVYMTALVSLYICICISYIYYHEDDDELSQPDSFRHLGLLWRAAVRGARNHSDPLGFVRVYLIVIIVFIWKCVFVL